MSAIAVPVMARRPGWRRLFGFNMLTGIVLGIGGWYLGHFIGSKITGANLDYYADVNQNDVAIRLNPNSVIDSPTRAKNPM